MGVKFDKSALGQEAIGLLTEFGVAAVVGALTGDMADAMAVFTGTEAAKNLLIRPLKGVVWKERSDIDKSFHELAGMLPGIMGEEHMEMPYGVEWLVQSRLLTPKFLLELLCQGEQSWHDALQRELQAICREDEEADIPEEMAEGIVEAVLKRCQKEIDTNPKLKEALVRERQFQELIRQPICTDNDMYARSFTQTLFLHTDSPDAEEMTLQNLYVMPGYKKIIYDEEHADGKERVDEEFGGNLEEKLKDFLSRDNEVPFLLIEGDAGAGKTTLSAWLNYQYAMKEKGNAEACALFAGRSLVTVRLRDLAGRTVNSGEQLHALVLQYMKVKDTDVLKRKYPNLVLLLDGFDELCMMKMVAQDQRGFFRELYEMVEKQRWKLIVTSRPSYFDRQTLEHRSYERIVLQHFDAEKRKEWMERYDAHSAVKIPAETRKYIKEIQDEEAEGICDTPMMLYMLTADGETGRYRENTWALYRHVFGSVMSRTKYNQVFPDADGTAPHRVAAVRKILYQVTEEIAFTMFQNSTKQFFLREDAIRQILVGLRIEFPELEDADTEQLVEQCYGLCCYWKSQRDEQASQGSVGYTSLDEDLDEELCPQQAWGQGAVEFLHNNIRDFFLAEKLYRELNRTAVALQTGKAKDYTALTDTLSRLLWYDELPRMVPTFIRLRAAYEKERREKSGGQLLDFAGYEAEQSRNLPGIQREIALILRDMSGAGICGNGGDRPGVLGQETKLSLHERTLYIVKNTITIYRCAYEPYLEEEETICWCPVSEEEIVKQRKAGAEEEHWANDGKQLVYAMFSDIFSGNSLGSRGDFSGAMLYGVCLSGANLYGANLYGAYLYGADLYRTYLHKSDLREAKLSGAVLQDSFCSHDQEKQIKHLKSRYGKDLKI